MKQIYNTADYVFLRDDMLIAFTHAMSLGRSGMKIKPEKALNEFLLEYGNNTEMKITFNIILDYVCKALNQHPDDITVFTGRAKGRTKLRNIVSWFCYMYVEETIIDLAERFGYANHTSVLHGHDDVNNLLSYDKETQALIFNIKSMMIYDGYRFKKVYRIREKGYEYVTVQ